MRFPRVEVQRLLNEQFEHLEDLWDRDPYDEVKAIALTIKEFMGDRRITTVEQGIARYLKFKQDQSQRLADVGLAGGDLSERLPSAPRLEPQPA